MTVAAALEADSASPVGAARSKTITFGSSSSLIVFGSGGGSNLLTLNFSPSTAPLPAKFVIEVPAGYGLDLTAAPGTEVADGSLYVFGVDAPSSASGYGELVAKDPAAFLADPAAQACAPGLHAAVWELSTSLATQKVDVAFFVDPGGAPGVGYTLQSCPAGLGEGAARSEASLSLFGLGLTEPRAAGRYLWRTFVTPRNAPTYELQAVAALPASLTLRGRYDAKQKTAIVTGRFVEEGKPAGRRRVYVSASSGRTGSTRPTQTTADGTFSVRIRITRTTEFSVSVAPAEHACEGISSAPGGCLGAMTVPPDGAATTVTVHRRGEAVRAIRAVDQRLAERENLGAPDFPPGAEEDAAARDSCAYPTREADLTITGESHRGVLWLADEEQLSGVGAVGLTRVYATRRQAAAAFGREAVLATAKCELGNAPGAGVRSLRLGALPARARAFRRTFSDGDQRGTFDFVVLQRGRSVARLLFTTVNESPSIARGAIRKVVARLR